MNLRDLPARAGRKPISVPGLMPGMARGDSPPTVADVKTVVENVQKAFAAFKEQNDKELAELKKGSPDAVTKEHTDRINANITALEGQLKEMNTRIALANLGRRDDSRAAPEAVAYSKAFRNWVTTGDGERELHGLAVQAAMTTDSKPDGGYLTPKEMETAISRVVGVRSVMRSLGRVVEISTDSYTKLHNLGGTTSGWVAEKDSRANTNGPQLSELEFPTHEIYAMPAATQKLLDDARTNIEAWLAEEIAIEFAEEEGAAFISGTGVKKPRGFLAQTMVANASYAWGKIGFVVSGVAAAISDGSNNGTDKLIDLVHSLKSAYRANASFLMNDLTVAAVRKLKDGDSNYLWQPGAQLGTPSQLLGYSVNTDDNMPDIGAGLFPIAFGDWQRGYTIVDRIGVRMLRDPYSSKPYVLFYTTKRVGGNVSDFAAIKALKCST
jgi:HK97 family phage major capsid protein